MSAPGRSQARIPQRASAEGSPVSTHTLDFVDAVTRRQLMRDALAGAVLVTLWPAARAQHTMAMPPGKATSMVAAADVRAVSVEIRNFAFVPQQLTVTSGTRVSWINRDDEAHLVASTDGAFKASPAMDTDDTFAVTFDKPGSYP